MACSLENMPKNLVEVKMALAKKFCRSLKGCAAFMHLMQVSHTFDFASTVNPTFPNSEPPKPAQSEKLPKIVNSKIMLLPTLGQTINKNY